MFFFSSFFFFFPQLALFCTQRVPAVAPDSHSQPARDSSLPSVLPQFNNSHVSSESGCTEGLDVPQTIVITVEFPIRLWLRASRSASVSRGTEDSPEAHQHFFFSPSHSVLLMCELALFRNHVIGSSPGTGCRPSSPSFGWTISVWWSSGLKVRWRANQSNLLAINEI